MSLQRLAVLTSLGVLTLGLVAVAMYAAFLAPSLADATLNVNPVAVGTAPQALRLTVHDYGLVAVSHDDLTRWNLPVSTLSPDSVRLEHEGAAVPFHVQGEGEDATLYFFARPTARTIKAPAVYLLSPGRGLSMARRNASPPGANPGVEEATTRQQGSYSLGWRQQRWEENVNFQPNVAGGDGWLNQPIYAPGYVEIPLTEIWPTTGPGRLTLQVWSGNQSPAYPDHHLEVWLNGYRLHSYYWDGKKLETVEVPITAGILREANNSLRLQVPGDTGAAGEAIYLDWISIEYEGLLNLRQDQLLFQSLHPLVEVRGGGEETLVFDVSDPEAPVRLVDVVASENGLRFANAEVGRRYLVARPQQAYRPQISAIPEWRRPLQQTERAADYIAIVPGGETFSETLRPLLDYRRAQGLRVEVVSAEQIYAEFSHGQPTPEAIRAFLRYAFTQWQPPVPHYVLLVGDASFDVPNAPGTTNDLLPTYLVHTEVGGHVASDTWFTLFDEDRLEPALAIGRLPVQSAEQLQVIVDKTLSYEEAGSAPWLDRALLVADDEERFNIASERLAEKLAQSGYQNQKLYMTQNEDIHDFIVSVLNHGVGVVNYVGHGQIDVWGDEMVLQAQDTMLLMNGERLPIFTTFTCLNGFFNHPKDDSLAETMLWAANGGIVAAVAPSGRTYSWQQTPLATAFFDALLTGQGVTLGDAVLRAKRAAAAEPQLGEAIHTFNLLGDPALGFHAPGPG